MSTPNHGPAATYPGNSTTAAHAQQRLLCLSHPLHPKRSDYLFSALAFALVQLKDQILKLMLYKQNLSPTTLTRYIESADCISSLPCFFPRSATCEDSKLILNTFRVLYIRVSECVVLQHELEGERSATGWTLNSKWPRGPDNSTDTQWHGSEIQVTSEHRSSRIFCGH